MYAGYKAIPLELINLPSQDSPIKYIPGQSDWYENKGDSLVLHNMPLNIRVEVKFDNDANDFVPIVPDQLVRFSYEKFRLKFIHLSQDNILQKVQESEPG